MTLRQGSTGDDVTVLQTILKALGLLDRVDGEFGILTFAAVRRFQRAKMLKDDGVVGSRTWTALLNEAPAEMPDGDELEMAGLQAVIEADRFWQLDITDPRKSDQRTQSNQSRAQIDKMLAAAGWDWEIPYLGDGQVEWCGIFVAACWRAAGIDPKWLATYFASTYRLDLWGRYQPFDSNHPNPAPVASGRLFATFGKLSTPASVTFIPRPGDILMVGDGNPEYGDHITLVEAYSAQRGVFSTIEGNGMGRGPDGRRRQGVVRAERRIGGNGYAARRLIRPSLGDLLKY